MPPARRGASTPKPSASSSSGNNARSSTAARKPAARKAAARKPAAPKTAATGAAAKAPAAKATRAGAARSARAGAAKATAPKATTTRTAGAKAEAARAAKDVEEGLELVAQRLRKLNERIIESGKEAGESTLVSYEKALKAIAGGIERGPGSSEIDWIANLATAQAKFIRELTQSWTSAARGLLKK